MGGIARKNKKAPAIQWTLRMRTVLHLLQTFFDFDRETDVRIFRQLYQNEMTHARYDDESWEVLDYRLQDHYRSRHLKGRENADWNVIFARQLSNEQKQLQEACKHDIRNAASALGIAVVTIDGDGEDEEEHEAEHDDTIPQDDEMENIGNVGFMEGANDEDAPVPEENAQNTDAERSTPYLSNSESNAAPMNPSITTISRNTTESSLQFHRTGLDGFSGRNTAGIRLSTTSPRYPLLDDGHAYPSQTDINTSGVAPPLSRTAPPGTSEALSSLNGSNQSNVTMPPGDLSLDGLTDQERDRLMDQMAEDARELFPALASTMPAWHEEEQEGFDWGR